MEGMMCMRVVGSQKTAIALATHLRVHMNGSLVFARNRKLNATPVKIANFFL